MRFQNGFNKVVIELSGGQFWSEIILGISDQIRDTKKDGVARGSLGRWTKIGLR